MVVHVIKFYKLNQQTQCVQCASSSLLKLICMKYDTLSQCRCKRQQNIPDICWLRYWKFIHFHVLWNKRVYTYNREEWKKHLRMARNLHILHMPTELMSKHIHVYIKEVNATQVVHTVVHTQWNAWVLTNFIQGKQTKQNRKLSFHCPCREGM
jgi:hypothetical protein